MRRVALIACALAFVSGSALLSGCGESENSEIKVSEEATKADDVGRKAMEDFMAGKSQKGSKASK